MALNDLINIGDALAAQLRQAGVGDEAALRAAGSRAAWLAIQAGDPSACYMRLCALEGAIQGVRWHNLPDGEKQSLKAFYAAHKVGSGS